MSRLHELLTDAIARKQQQDKKYITLEDRNKIKQITASMWGASRREYHKLRSAHLALLEVMPRDAIVHEGIMYNGKPFQITVQDQIDLLLFGM